LGLAGIALIWIFRVENRETTAIPQALFSPAFLLVLGLALDLCQYVACIWAIYHRTREKSGIDANEEFKACSEINLLTNIFSMENAL